MNTPRCKCWLQVLAALIIVCCGSILSAQSSSSQQSRFTFWGVLTDNEDQADQVLVRLLKDGTQFEIDKTRGEKYEVVIRRLIEASYNSSTDYLARVPPYVFVAAEMLGADLEPLATYRSAATNDVIYHSWFVVKKQDLVKAGITNPEPTIENLVTFVRYRSDHGDPVKFIYHDRFSTSSYFLPSLFFREHDIFSLKENQSGTVTSIRSSKPENLNRSGQLPKTVADGSGFLAAVSDGTKNEYQPQAGKELVFIRLSTTLPNDLLVCSKWLVKRGSKKPDQRRN